MEEVNEIVLQKILNQCYTDNPSQLNDLYDIDLSNKKIIILCGSGITRDYGIETFEEMKKVNYYDVFSHSNYENDTLNFYKNVNELKKRCLNLNKINSNNIFIVTTNIDGMFIGTNVFEVHGNIFENKCIHCNTVNYCEKIEDLPLCSSCGNITKPNIQLYGDCDFSFNETQMKKYINFKNNMTIDDTLIFEVGCGLSVPILRHEFEVLKQKQYNSYRINLKDFDNTTKNIKLNGNKFIEYIFNQNKF